MLTNTHLHLLNNAFPFVLCAVDLLQMLEMNMTIAFPAAPLLTVILALVGRCYLSCGCRLWHQHVSHLLNTRCTVYNLIVTAIGEGLYF